MTGQTVGKIGVVVGLAVVVAAVLVAKKAPRAETTVPAVQASATEIPAPASQPTAAPVSAALPRLLDLGSTSCIPCKMMAPILDELKAQLAGELQVDFIDVWKDEAAGQRYGVHLIPTQIFFDREGKELWRHEGFMGKDEILNKWKELGVELPGAAASQPAPRAGA